MKAIKIITATLVLMVTLPIRLYITYSLLKAVNADRLVWFLFWIDIPVFTLVSVLEKVAQSAKGDK